MKAFLLCLSFPALAFFLHPLPLCAQNAADPGPAVFRTAVYFAFGKAELTTDARKALEQAVAAYRQASGATGIRISAHTDASGSVGGNMVLSGRRAAAVRDALLALNIPAEKIDTFWYGESRPAESNATEAGRGRNRRAEVEVMAPQLLGKAPEPTPVVTPLEPAPPVIVPFRGLVKDKASGNGVPAMVYYETQSRRDSVRADGAGRYSFQAPFSTTVKLSVLAPGYLLANSTAAVPSATAPEPYVTELDPVDTGKTIALQNLHFYADQVELMEESQPEMDNLLRFMQMNPKLRVEIAGHVSLPLDWGMPMTPELWQLSRDRAKKIYDYLVSNGIPAGRMTHKGYGNTEMLFPNASTRDEERQNRRVEIRVVGKD